MYIYAFVCPSAHVRVCFYYHHIRTPKSRQVAELLHGDFDGAKDLNHSSFLRVSEMHSRMDGRTDRQTGRDRERCKR